jgi:DNA-binding FadR family transcriptional regulator
LLESLEVICSRAACRCMSDKEMDKLAELIERMDGNTNNPEQWSQSNKQLHLFVCECSKNILTMKMTQKVLDHWDRLRLHYLKDVFGNRIVEAQQEHKQILAAFRTRNADAVEQAVRRHNQNALKSYLEHLQSKGQITSEDGCS